ncbi:DUF4240 domain-containing protein [Streptomyces sp. NPDC014724]|uniref:DUF4240 domain-containing protein n=1 Tax=unclassified Streptomyces TaxID=2593676 RepID=UPI0037015D40
MRGTTPPPPGSLLREVFEQVVAEPDTLAELPEIRAAAAKGEEAECESTLAVAWQAHRAATGENLPGRTPGGTVGDQSKIGPCVRVRLIS